MTIDMSQFYQVFFEESAEHLAAMEGLLLDLDVDNPDSEQLNAIFRAAHSIKGSAGTFGFNDLAETTHILENLLDRIRKQELGLRADMVDAFLESGDLLRDMLEAHQGRGVVDAQAVESICCRLRQLSSGDGVQPAAPHVVAKGTTEVVASCPQATSKRVFDIQFVPTEVSAKGNGIANLLDEFRSMGSLEIVNQPEAEMRNIGYWQVRLTTEASQDEFSDQIDFIAENGAWRVVEDISVASDADSAFGFFGNSPGAPEEDSGYGFFAPLVSASIDDGDGYGFFEPLPTASVTTKESAGDGEEADGYGFFAPLPPPVVATSVAEDGDGFGFFAPLPTTAVSDLQADAALSERRSEAVSAEKQLPEVRVRSSKGSVQANASTDSSIRVSIEKVDQLINLVGELVITQAMLLQTAEHMQEKAPERLINGLAQLERNTRDLQESVMSIRMMQISFVFSRFPRVVRDLSSKLGKQVELKTLGETTELRAGPDCLDRVSTAISGALHW